MQAFYAIILVLFGKCLPGLTGLMRQSVVDAAVELMNS